MDQDAIAVDHFYKFFGDKEIVSDLSFVVKKGEFFAFLGTNGAGKTTTMRTLLGMYQPDKGSLLIDGQKYTQDRAGLVGYLPEERGLFLNSGVLETLIYFGQLKGMDHENAKIFALLYLERVDLLDKSKLQIKALSSGQQQKIQLGITFIGNPKILILDEPSKGLDPFSRSLFFEMLLESIKNGVSIMLSTHNLQEIEHLATHVLILKNGKSVLDDSMSNMKKRFGSNISLDDTFIQIVRE